MKKKGLLIILFAFVCLLVVGCGKEKESELITQDNDTIKNVESKKKDSNGVSTLSCTFKLDNDTTSIMVIEQKNGAKVFSKVTSVVTKELSKTVYKQVLDSKNNHEGGWDYEKTLFCDEDDELTKSCDVELGKYYLKWTSELVPAKYANGFEEIINNDYANALKNIKEHYETEQEGTCTLS